MGRKKKKTSGEKQKFAYTVEIISLVMIFISIIGLVTAGMVGGFVRKITIYLFGSWFWLLLLFGFGLGIYLIVNRRKPNYFTARLIGIYFLIIGLLIFSHIEFVKSYEEELKPIQIINKTQENIDIAFEEINSNESNDILSTSSAATKSTAGGMVGALVTALFVWLFDITGTIIVTVLFGIFGLIMIFDVNLGELFKSIGRFFKNIFTMPDEEDDDEDSEKESSVDKTVGNLPEEEISEKKVIITSMNDLREPSPKEEDTKEEHLEIDDTPGIYVKPSISLLDPVKNKNMEANSNEVIAKNIKALEQVFLDFDMHVKVIEVHAGPAVTQYEMEISKGTRVTKVLGISREIALALAAKEVRIEAPIPGKNTVGVEIPNQVIIPVSMREIMEAMKQEKKLEHSPLAAPLGRDIMGNVKYVEINKTPHMLVAGSTGSGKSVCINNIILSVLMRTTPDEVKMVLVDPKKVEFNVYEGIPHLLIPVVTDPKKASVALQKIVVEMDERYETFKNSGTKKIDDYNDYVDKELKKNPECGLRHMPYILVIIDELADLMLVAAKEVEESIMRITQLARAAGIHLIVATQRPSTDIITGVVKSNIPTRISFAVSSSIDSRTILDMTGAEKLLGRGDMLYKPQDDNNPTRVQGSFVSDDEIKRVVDFIKKRCSGPKYSEKFQNLDTSSSSGSGSAGGSGGSDDAKDVLYDEILEYAIRMGQISASLIQRKYSIGYNRAARIIDQFEERGIVGPAKGSKPRDVLVKLSDDGSEE